MTLKGRVVVPGVARGKLLVIPDNVSFYGELEKRDLSGKILLVEGTRGSTVAPYVIYRMCRRGVAPNALLIATRVEPMIIAGAVLAELVLVDSLAELNPGLNLQALQEYNGVDVEVDANSASLARITVPAIRR